MVTLIQSPGPVNLLNDEVKLRFYADGRLQAPGGKGQVSIYVSSANMVLNAWLQFDFDGITERITFVTSPDSSGNQCKLLTTSIFSTWTTQHLFPALQNNYNLSRYFIISHTSGSNTIQLTARQAAAISLSVTKYSGTTGLTIGSVQPGSNPIYRQGYGLIVQTWARSIQGVWDMAGEDRIIPDSNGYAGADFGELLRRFARPAFFPSMGDVVIPMASMSVQFRFRYCEIWDSDPQLVYTTPDYVGIFGGLPRSAHAALDNTLADWWGAFVSKKKFLNNLPDYIPTTTSSPQRLYWICPVAGLSRVDIKVKSWNLGGINDLTMASIQNPVQYRVYCIDTSYNRMMLNLWSSPNDLRYEVRVQSPAGAVLAGPQGYLIDRAPTRWMRYFVFRNSLGGFDTLISRGRQTTELETDRYVAEMNSDGEQEAWLNEAWYKYTQNAGAMLPQYREYLAEFLLSTEVYLLRENYSLQRVIVRTEKAPLAADGDPRPVFSFEYTAVTKDQFYSNHF